MNADAARTCARAIIGDVARGVAVGERKRGNRRTFDDLWNHYLNVHAKPTKRTWQRDEAEYKRLLQPVLGNASIVNVKRAAVKQLIADIEVRGGKGPARKARALLSKMYEVAIDSEWCEANPVRKTRRPEYEDRQRYIREGEIAAFIGAVQKLRSGTAKDFILLALWTGARRSNVCSMRWDELDLQAGLWHIPAAKMKGKKPQTVPLSTHALDIIRARKGNDSEYVLPGKGRNNDGHYRNPKDAWKRVLISAGLKDLRIHDLRRSAGSWAQKQGASLRTIQAQLGHATPDITARIYSTVETEQIRAASQAAGDAMLAAASDG